MKFIFFKILFTLLALICVSCGNNKPVQFYTFPEFHVKNGTSKSFDLSKYLDGSKKTITFRNQNNHKLSNNIIRNMNSIINNNSEKIENHQHYLKNLDPKQVLERGYSIAFNKQSNKIIRSSKMLSNGERFYLKTGSGSLEAEKLSDINS